MAAYLLIFMTAVIGIHRWKVKRRGGQPPVEFKLLRGPGETLRRRITAHEEDLLFNLALTALIPPVSAIAVFFALVWLRPHTSLSIGLGLTGLTFAIVAIPSARLTLRRLKRNRDDRLGYLGEREVAEHLEPLLAHGYRVFHDVPAKGAKGAFNLDHVAIGPGGVALIETKTIRKGRARPGTQDHVVTFDGERLIWPWGENRLGLDQAAHEARWLGDLIKQRVGIATTVKPILALPGWYVDSKGRGAVAVINAKNIAREVAGSGAVVLSEQQIDLIARQLDAPCRDVED